MHESSKHEKVAVDQQKKIESLENELKKLSGDLETASGSAGK